MERTIKKVIFSTPIEKPLTRVAAYARVSNGKEEMLHSLSTQVSYYSSLIQSHIGWQYVGVYADEAKTGTKDSRENFQRLLSDCRTEKIDMVITKSISRFARNTVTLLNTIRELKDIGIDVYFEEQNVHTLSADGELLITLLASYAQEESRSASENQKWRVRKNFREGIPWNHMLYGYKFENNQFVIVPEEAKVVKLIYDCYLSGMGIVAIEKELAKRGIYTKQGKKWGKTHIYKVLSNYNYTGNLLLQRTYRKDFLTKETVMNNGELPKYHVENSHEAIISVETYKAVQAERKRREIFANRQVKTKVFMPFSGKIFCGLCGKTYRRKTTATGIVWICYTYNTYGKSECPSKQLPEEKLLSLISEVTDDCDRIERIVIKPENLVEFTLKDGTVRELKWKDRSRSESWTPEMKEAARQKTLERIRKKCKEQ